jgi:hypothetical protein
LILKDKSLHWQKKGKISLELEKRPVTSAELLVVNDCNSVAVRIAAP